MKLYTRTVCPKCMLVKTLLNAAELDYEISNLDFDAEAEEKLKEEGFMSLPILEVDGTFYADVPAIQALIAEKAE